jgi:glyoxylase I family protein
MSNAAAHEATVTIRYQVSDIERSIDFYTERFGFRPGTKSGTAFADVSRGNLRLILSGPGSSGSRAMPDGRRQEPGGWNRIVLAVDDLASQVVDLEKAGVRFRNRIEVGPGGKQILVEDPDGNPIELHEYPHSGHT